MSEQGLMQPIGPADCGCTPQVYVCGIGRQIAIDIFCGNEVIMSPLFPSRPAQEREMLLAEHQRNIDRYMQHCGYVFPDQGMVLE